MKREVWQQNYGLYIVAIWSAVLGVQNASNLFLISTTVQSSTASSIFFYQLISFCFSLSFFGAAVGLWRAHPWGRHLFLIATLLFFLISLIGLFRSDLAAATLQQKWLFGMRYLLSMLLPLLYLNLSSVKQRFEILGAKIKDKDTDQNFDKKTECSVK